MYPQRVTVWCGFWSRGLIGPYFFFWRYCREYYHNKWRMLFCNDIWFPLPPFGITGDGYGLKHRHSMVATGRSNMPYLQRYEHSSEEKVFGQTHLVACISTLATAVLRPKPLPLFYGALLSRHVMRSNPVILLNLNKKSEDCWENWTAKCVSASSQIV